MEQTAFELLLTELRERYKKSTLSKREMAYEMGISYSGIDKMISKGYGIPNYKKLGEKSNSRIIFTIVEAAKFLSQTVKTA